MNPFKKFDAVGFFSNILAVILGIVITFSIQWIVDRKNEKENINSALQLVQKELAGCRQDLEKCAEFLDNERVATLYLQKNMDKLNSCPQDSVATYGSVYITELILTLPDDALELLKTSSIFSSINDNELSLAIIKAYDQCNMLKQIFNRHEELKAETLKRIFLEKGVDKCFTPNGTLSIYELMNTKSGSYLTSQLLAVSAGILEAGFEDLDNAVQAIEAYLSK